MNTTTDRMEQIHATKYQAACVCTVINMELAKVLPDCDMLQEHGYKLAKLLELLAITDASNQRAIAAAGGSNHG